MSFGPFRLSPAQMLLLEDEKPVRLGTRAFAILAILVQRAGELVGKEELIARVWPSILVDEGSLRVHVAALRKALRDGQGGRRYVTTVNGRGYCFVAPVSPSLPGATSLPSRFEPTRGLPRLPTRMVGRDDIVAALVERLPQRRFVTIVGPGGIGKTTVALAVAHALAERYEDGAHLVDLAPLTDPSLVPSAVASVLGVPIRAEDPIAGLVTALRGKHALLLVDSCERVADMAALLAEEVVKGTPDVHVLATSREPLRAGGEHVRRLGPLSVPPMSAGMAASDALAYPAVQLFVGRATASLGTFELVDANADLVADVCRRLDGIALAIELAAGVVDTLGLEGVAEGLDDRFRLLIGGRRTALPRHRTLLATLDWSHELLPEIERVVLRRVAVFAGAFSLADVMNVAAGGGVTDREVAARIADLVDKSLVVTQPDGSVKRYRLLDSTRAYASEKLVQSGELPTFARRHAEHYRGKFERAEAEWSRTPSSDWLAAYRPDLGDLRVALDRAFTPNGDTVVGEALTAAAVPLWFQLSLVHECLGRVERALALPQAGTTEGKRLRMKLHAALGWSLMYTGTVGRETRIAWTTTLALAEELGDTDYRLRALWGLWADHIRIGEFSAALDVARKFCGLATSSSDPADALVGDRMAGAALHFLGDQAGARRHIERMLAGYVTPVHGAHIVRFQFDQRAAAGMTLARVLWLQGFADQAMLAAEGCVEEALRSGHALSLCNALAQGAIPVSLLTGDWAASERFIALLHDTAARHGLHVWRSYGHCFQGQLLIQRGAHDAGVRLVRGAVDELRDARFMQFRTAFLGALADGLALAGQFAAASDAIDEALLRCERAEERWIAPELLRVKGEVTRRQSIPDAVESAEAYLEQSRTAAQEHGALSWELRAAISLARHRRAEARGRLAAVLGRFSEGFATADLKAAKDLLTELEAL